MKRHKVNVWYQIAGDASPERYGGTYAREDAHGCIDVRVIQPVREHVSEGEASEVGFPFWAREAWYTRDDLQNPAPHALSYSGVEHSDFNLRLRSDRFALAAVLACYSVGVNEGPSGWSRDVLVGIGRAANRVDYRVVDCEFRRLLRRNKRSNM